MRTRSERFDVLAANGQVSQDCLLTLGIPGSDAMRALVRLLPALLLGLMPTIASADEQTFTDYARVESVEPIIVRERVTEPVQQCRPVRAASPISRSPHYRNRIRPPHEVVRSVVGGLIGGALGSRIGGGSGRRAMTVIGAMAGASVANSHAREDRYREYVYHRNADGIAERCEQVLRVRDIETITGYRVHYRYQGERGTRIVSEPPGDRVRVEVSLRPVVHAP